MAAPHRSTLPKFWTAFFEHMKKLEGTTAGTNFRYQEVVEGEAGSASRQPPFVLAQFVSATVQSRADNAKTWLCQMRIRVVSNIPARDGATSELLARIAQVENHVESFANPTGVTGAGSEMWTFTFPISPEGGGRVQADSIRNYSVTIDAGAN
jgi:hypothetical protein